MYYFHFTCTFRFGLHVKDHSRALGRFSADGDNRVSWCLLFFSMKHMEFKQAVYYSFGMYFKVLAL